MKTCKEMYSVVLVFRFVLSISGVCLQKIDFITIDAVLLFGWVVWKLQTCIINFNQLSIAAQVVKPQFYYTL